MRGNGLKAAVLIAVCWLYHPAASDAEVLAVRNCNWCHGGSASGYPPAPALAAQRPQYVESSLPISAPTRATIHLRDSICGGQQEISTPTLYGI